MIDFLKKELNKTNTENGAYAYKSTMDSCLDLFSCIGAIRDRDRHEIIEIFKKAYQENADNAMKILFFARDIRGGLGERRVFRIICNWLSYHHTESMNKNIPYIAQYGRWDDLLEFIDTPCEAAVMDCFYKQAIADMKAKKRGESISLLAKWLPSINASNSLTRYRAKRIAKWYGMTHERYRKTLSEYRVYLNIIENNLREKDYSFDYSKQPSRAMMKYRNAFMQNDADRYNAFIQAVRAGKSTLNAANVAPYELVEKVFEDDPFTYEYKLNEAEEAAINATWESLPDYGNGENMLAVVDVSGSMFGRPMAVSVSLGLYIAEHNSGVFKNHFLTFSSEPELVQVVGDGFVDRIANMQKASWGYTTNLEAIFSIILETAKTYKLPQAEMPTKLVIISDMEFDMATNSTCSQTILEMAKEMYANNGYKLPDVIFWNADSRNMHQPVTMNEAGVALVSGVTPRIFKMIAGGIIDPYSFMLEVIESERYAKIKA